MSVIGSRLTLLPQICYRKYCLRVSRRALNDLLLYGLANSMQMSGEKGVGVKKLLGYMLKKWRGGIKGS